MKARWLVICVLRSGGDFNPFHVESLQRQCAKHFRNPHDFLCLTDLSGLPLPYEPLVDKWKGWWSKIEVFQYQQAYGLPTLYIDLDTVVTGDFSFETAPEPEEIWMLKDFLNFDNPSPLAQERKWASGIFAWSGDFSFIHREMAKGDTGNLQRRWAWDQAWMQNCLSERGSRVTAINDHLRIQSYKLHGLRKRRPDPDVQIVCFHGQPRPWDPGVAEWVKEARDVVPDLS